MKTRFAFAALVLVSFGVGRAEEIAVRGPHPRVFYTAERVAELKQRLPQEKSSTESWNAVVAAADAAVQKPAGAGKVVEQLELAYRMTGEAKYAAPIREFLLKEIARKEWNEAEMLRRDPPWHSALGLAAEVQRTAVAFDTIHDYLSAEDRQKIAQGIVERGILPTLNDWVLGGQRIHALDTMGHNWWSACVFSAGIGCLAVLDEEPRANAWLKEISAGSVEWFAYSGSLIENKPATFDPAGGFYESVNYASFAMSEYLLFRLAWTNALTTPAPEIPLLAKVGDFFVNVAYPNSGPVMTLNFGDGSIHADGSRPLALLWANGYRSPTGAWYLNAARQMSYREGLDRSTPFGLVYFPSDADLARAPQTPPLPPSTIYAGMGWAMLRSSWANDATLLGVKSGYTWNHSHADEGSFVLFHRGQNLLIDSGNGPYNRAEYDAYYRQGVAHNVVTFDGQAENPEDTYFGSKFPGSVSHLIDTGDLKYVFADATGPTSHLFDRNYRHFLWVGDVILVIDDVDAFVPGQFAWLLHTAAPAVRKGLDVTVEQAGASVVVRPLFPETFPDAGLPSDYPEKLRFVEKTGLADHDADRKVPYYAFEPTELTRRTKFINAITLVTPENKDRLPQIERLTGKDAIGVRIRQAGMVTDVYLNLRADGRIRHRNANNTLGGWETDAYLLATTYRGEREGAGNKEPGGTKDQVISGGGEKFTRVFVADGSYLRKDGVVVLDSLSKVFATWTNRAGALEVVLQGQPVLNVRLRSDEKPSEVRVNGETIAAPYDADAKQLTISTVLK